MEAKMDLTMFKEIPGYKAILKAVLKSQIQMLVEQLSEAEEESVVLTASLTDGTLSHLGSMAGKNFLDERQEIKSQFLFHCLKKKTNIQSPSQDHVFHGSRSSTTLIDQEPGFIPGRTSTTVPNQEPVFIPEMGPLDVSPQQEERLAKRPRRTLPEIPFSFGRGRAVNTGITFEQGLQDMHSGPFGQGLALARGSRGRGTAVGRGFVAGRGIPSARGAASGRGRRHGKFSTRGRGRGVRRISSAATATITSPDQNIESDEVKYEFNDVSIENTGKAEPDLVTIKAENFEVSIDLNSPVEKSTKPVSLRKNSSVDMSPSVKLKRLSNKAVKTASTPMKAPSDSDNENMDNQSIGNKHDDDSGNDDDDKEGNEYGTENDASSLNTDNSVSMDDSLNVNKSLNVSHVNIKQEAPDDDELLGMETCATQQYGVSLPGPSGEMGKQSLANTETDANGAQSSNKVDKQTPRSAETNPPVYKYLDQSGNLKMPQTGPCGRKYAVKRKLSQKTIEEKYLTILEVEKGSYSKTQIAKANDIRLNTLSGWIKDAEAIKAAYLKFGPGRRTKRTSDYQELDEELLKWCKNMLDKNVQLSGPIMLERIDQLKNQLGLNSCKVSSGWLERFKERHGIKFKRPPGSSKIQFKLKPAPSDSNTEQESSTITAGVVKGLASNTSDHSTVDSVGTANVHASADCINSDQSASTRADLSDPEKCTVPKPTSDADNVETTQTDSDKDKDKAVKSELDQEKITGKDSPYKIVLEEEEKEDSKKKRQFCYKDNKDT